MDFQYVEKVGVYSCNGFLAANTRALQYKYNSIDTKAQSIAKRKGCKWTAGSKRSRKSRRRSRKRSHHKSRRSKSRRRSR